MKIIYSKKKLIEVNVGESDDEEEEPVDDGEDDGRQETADVASCVKQEFQVKFA